MASKRRSSNRKVKFPANPDDSKENVNNNKNNQSIEKDKEVKNVDGSELIDGKELRIIEKYIQVLKSGNSSQQDRMVSMNRLLQLSHSYGFTSLVIKSAGIPALVKQLQQQGNQKLQSTSALVITLMLSRGDTKDIRQPMLDAGAIPALISLLKTVVPKHNSNDLVKGIYHAALSISYLAKGSTSVKNETRINGGIPPLVRFLTSHDKKLTGVALLTLNELVLDLELNKLELIKCKALPFIIEMIDSKNAEFQLNSVGILVSLVASSNIQKLVLAAGALRRVMSLLRSQYEEICIEAVTFIRHVVSGSDYKDYPLEIHNAVEPLIALLRSKNDELQKNSSYALCKIAQDPGLYATFLHYKGISPLLDFLDVKDLQISSASAIYGFASGESAVAELIKKGAIQKLLSVVYIEHYPRMILQRIEDNITELTMELLTHYLAQSTGDVKDKMNLLLGMRYISSQETVRKLFASCQGDDLLVAELLNLLNTTDQELKTCACLALSKIAQNSSASCANAGQVRTSENFTNPPTHTDVNFIVQGKRFPSNREILIGKSEVFRAMFARGFKETLCKEVRIENITSDIFEMFLRFIHSGSVEIGLEYSPDLFEAADQYGLMELKELCVNRMSKEITACNLRILYDFAEFYTILTLKDCCVVFTLEHCEELHSNSGYERLFYEIIPEIRSFFERKVPKFAERASSEIKSF
ncbi:ARM repeat protein interacting with ABF2 [Tanacetum coccineum]|uniref:ARM repeat protein interacting with ABF2 n=1 Tax=Tanacetum coccineum TaxID=301880 RepID=A0ABQ4WQN6_9ASTR